MKCERQKYIALPSHREKGCRNILEELHRLLKRPRDIENGMYTLSIGLRVYIYIYIYIYIKEVNGFDTGEGPDSYWYLKEEHRRTIKLGAGGFE